MFEWQFANRWEQRPITYENNVNDFSATKIITKLKREKRSEERYKEQQNSNEIKWKLEWRRKKVTGDHLIKALI